MSEPISFGSVTSRHSLPLLFAGQAQKEFYYNSALNSLDLLVQTTVSGFSDTPPSNVMEGDTWLVAAFAQGDWAGHEDEIAVFSSGAWKFFPARQGMRLFNDDQGQFMHFDARWKIVSSPASPQSGATIDVEARAAIDELIVALQEAGIFPRL